MLKIVAAILMFLPIIGQTQPSQDFFTITKKIEDQGFRADTSRAKKGSYKELLTLKPSIIDSRIFYKTAPELTKIISLNSTDNYLKDQTSLDLFNNVKSIWTYYYRSDVKDKTNTIKDGIIEQWEFSTQEQAILAITKLNSTYPLPFFNTQPCYIQSKNILYVFHTRADAFSYKQKEFFNLFKELLK